MAELLIHWLDAYADYVCDVQRAHVLGGPAYLVLVFLGHGSNVIPCDSASQKTVERTQVQRTERIVDVTVVIPHEAQTVMSVQKTVDVQQTQFLDRVVDLQILRDTVFWTFPGQFRVNGRFG